MTDITAGSATSTLQAAPAKARNNARKGIFARAWSAFVESRVQQAEREIERHRHLLPIQLESAALRVAHHDDSLPFVR